MIWTWLLFGFHLLRAGIGSRLHYSSSRVFSEAWKVISHSGSIYDRLMTQDLWCLLQHPSPTAFHLLASRCFVAELWTPWSYRLFLSIVLIRGQVPFADKIVYVMMMHIFSLLAWLHWVAGLSVCLCCLLGIGTRPAHRYSRFGEKVWSVWETDSLNKLGVPTLAEGLWKPDSSKVIMSEGSCKGGEERSEKQPSQAAWWVSLFCYHWLWKPYAYLLRTSESLSSRWGIFGVW